MRSADASQPLTIPSSHAVELRLHDLGGSGQDLLFAHATGFHGLVWAPLAAHLTEYHSWAPDLRGHGASNAPDDGDFAWAGFAEDVLAVVDEIHRHASVGGQLAAVGHSKGGAALLLAEQARPGTFAALYLYEPVVFPGDPIGPDGKVIENPLAAGARRRRSRFTTREEAYANYSSKPPLSVLEPAVLRAYVDHGFTDAVDDSGRPLVELACAPEHEARTFENGLVHRAFEHLADVRCPTVVATGRPDEFGPAMFAPAIVDALPDGRLEVFESLGHLGPLEDPATVATSVRQAFER